MVEDTQFLVEKARATSSMEGKSSGTLPADLLRQSADRLGGVCLIYALAFFMANFFASMVAGELARKLSSFENYGPGAVSIAAALLVFGLTRSSRVPLTTLMVLGLVFEVVGSFGIAFAEFWGINRDTQAVGYFGLSWVAAWVICFTVVVPNRPRRSLLAALLSGAAVPITVALSMQYGGTQLNISANQFAAGLVLPYLIVTGMAYGGARTVYGLGNDVRRAREMGSYRLEALIGRGGMGEVWRAQHRMLARPAAVKLIRAQPEGTAGSPLDATVLRRFEQEAQNTAALRSPHTIGVYDYGLSEDGSFYYVMELLDGFDLDTLVIRHGPQPPERVVHILRQACHSLQEAHKAGLVHRDVKPANLFVCRYGDDLDFVKILDFGLVTERGTARAGDTEAVTKLTREGTVVGSPAFMPPEMLLDESDIDGRADIYALGCVAYWLLTGALVFEAESPLAMLVSHARDAPTPPSVSGEFEIPEELEMLVLACLEKDPVKRPQSARELSDRLDAVGLEPLWSEARRARWWQTHSPRTAPPGPR